MRLRFPVTLTTAAIAALALLIAPHAASCGTPPAPAGFVPLPSLAAPAAPAPLALLPSAAAPTLAASLVAYIDPETGALTNTIPLQAPVDLLVPLADTPDLPQVQLPNGSWMIDTRGIMLENLVITVDPLGHRRLECTRDPRAAKQADAAPILTPYAER